MPQRTNEFQKLVHMIQMAVAPTGAIVTESAMEDEREIDILVEASVGPYRIKIAVEAKDTKRPVDIQVIEQLIGRYKTLGGQHVDKLVIVSRNGYSKRARERALEANIELFVLDEVQQSDWTKLVPQKLFFRIAPKISRVETSPAIPDKGNQNAVQHGRFYCTCHGHDKGSPLQRAEWVFRTQIVGNVPVMEKIQAEAQKRGGACSATIPMPLKNWVLRFQGYDYPVNELRVEVQVTHADNDIEWTSYKYVGADGTDKVIDQFESSVAGSKIKVLFPEGPTSPKLSVSFGKDENARGEFQELPATNLCFDTIHAPFCPKHYPSARPANLVTKPKTFRKQPAVAKPDSIEKNPSASSGS